MSSVSPAHITEDDIYNGIFMYISEHAKHYLFFRGKQTVFKPFQWSKEAVFSIIYVLSPTVESIVTF